MKIQYFLKGILYCMLFLTIGILISCDSAKYRDTSEFILQPYALKDGEKVRLLAYFYINSNRQKNVYNHVIAISEESGDTCNILIPWDHGFKETDENIIYNYIGPENLVNTLDIEKMTFSSNDLNIDDYKTKFPDYKKVIRIPEFDDIAINNFPTVKGSLGTIRNQ